MKKNSDEIKDVLGIRCLVCNQKSNHPGSIYLGEDIGRSKNNALRSALYQTGEDIDELKSVKAQMIQTLKKAEDRLISTYVKESFGFKMIK